MSLTGKSIPPEVVQEDDSEDVPVITETVDYVNPKGRAHRIVCAAAILCVVCREVTLAF